MPTLLAGASSIDITPDHSLHLFGYPHVERFSTGINDPLFSSALCIQSNGTTILMIANDIIFVPKAMVQAARTRIHEATTIPTSHILISATHTHSGPDTVSYASNAADSTVPPLNKDYLQQLENAIVQAAIDAHAALRSAEIGFTIADASCVGTNRRDPQGPAHPDMPILVVRDKETQQAMAINWICSMHPTVLHEDSTVYSGDFPGYTRAYVQQQVLGDECVVLHHCGASGNQSPRHVVSDTTLAEAERLGYELAQAVKDSMNDMTWLDHVEIMCAGDESSLPLRNFISVEEAQKNVNTIKAHYHHLQDSQAPYPEVRTAECDVFGAEETLTLSNMAQSGQLETFAQTCLPAEIQLISIGPWDFLAFPGELFVEYALDIEQEFPNAKVITLANGELQGYLVTEESIREGGYEASNALFPSPESPAILVEKAKNLLRAIP